MAGQDNPQDKRQLRKTYSGGSARVAARPESPAALSNNSIFRDDCHLPTMIGLTGGYGGTTISIVLLVMVTMFKTFELGVLYHTAQKARRSELRSCRDYDLPYVGTTEY